MSFAGFNSSKFVKGRLQAALYFMRKKNRLRRADPGTGGVTAQQVVAALFGNGEAGFFINWRDTTQTFQDTAGTVPALAAGDPVRRVNDFSGNGHYVTMGAGAAFLAADVRGLCVHFLGGAAADSPVTNNPVDLSGLSVVSVADAGAGRNSSAVIYRMSNGYTQTAQGVARFQLIDNVNNLGTLAPSYLQLDANTGTTRRRDHIADTANLTKRFIGQVNAGSTLNSIFTGESNGVASVLGGAGGAVTPGTFSSHVVNFGVGYSSADALTGTPWSGWRDVSILVGRAFTANEIAMLRSYLATHAPSRYTLPPGHTVDILLVAGQSNAEGRGTMSLSPATTRGGIYASGAVSPLLDPVGNATTGSAWPAFANAYHNAKPDRTLLVVELATGGSGLLVDGNPASNWSPSGTLRAPAVTAANAAIAYVAALPSNTLGKVFVAWAQGEQEVLLHNGTTITGPLYQAATTELFDYFTANLTQLDAILVSEVGDRVPAAANFEAIRAAQAAAVAAHAKGHMAFSGAKDFPSQSKMSDAVHYTQAGYNEMGEAMGAYAATLS